MQSIIRLWTRTRRKAVVRTIATACGLAMLLPLAAAAAGDAEYPSRPMRFVVPFPPGSGTDTTARVFAKKITDLTGQGIVVENKPGGNGFIGVQTVLGAPPDGYTVFIGSNSTLSTNAATFRKLPYDPLTDLAPVSLLSRGPCLVLVPANSRYTSLKALLDAAREKPQVLNYGSGSMSYTLYTEWLNEQAGVKTTGVPYKGAGDAINAVLAGNVDFAVVDAGGALELAKSNKVRALALTAPKRSPLLPDVPTTAEAGLPNYECFNWVAAMLPAKAPPALVQKLHTLFKEAGASDEVKNYFKRYTSDLIMSTPAELRQYQTDEITRWKRLMSVTKMELQ